MHFRTMARDVARAVRFVHDRADELGVDPMRIFLCGHSAGAHLSALVALDPQVSIFFLNACNDSTRGSVDSG